MTDEVKQEEEKQSEKPDNGKVAGRSEIMVAQNFGSRAEVREMYDRIQHSRPSWLHEQAPMMAILSLAAVSLAHGLDPWLNEIWLIYNPDKGEWWIQAGIKGLRKAARKQLPDRAQYYVKHTPIIPGSEEWEAYHLDDNDSRNRAILMAVRTTLTRTDILTSFSENVEKLCAAGGKFLDVVEMLGGNPTFEGIGIVRVGEKSKMEMNQLVRKRGEADALKQAFDLPFEVPDDDRINGADIPREVVEGTLIEAGEDTKVIPFPASEPTPPEPAPIEIPDRPAEPEALRVYFKALAAQSKVANGISQPQSGGVLGLIAKMFGNDKTKRHTLFYYLSGQEDIKKWSGAMASAFINIFKSQDPDSWDLNEHALTEVERILRKHAEGQGQLDMFEDKEPAKDKPKPAAKSKTTGPVTSDGRQLDDLDTVGSDLKGRRPVNLKLGCKWFKEQLSLNWTEEVARQAVADKLGIEPEAVKMGEHWEALVDLAVEAARA